MLCPLEFKENKYADSIKRGGGIPKISKQTTSESRCLTLNPPTLGISSRKFPFVIMLSHKLIDLSLEGKWKNRT